MIHINLLPKELQKKKKSFKIPDITMIFLPTVLGLIGVLVLVQVLLMTVKNFKSKAYVRLDKEWSETLPHKQEVTTLKLEVRTIQQKVLAIDNLMIKRVLWARKLNQLSDAMIPGIWLTGLSLDKKSVSAKSPAKQQLRRGRRAAQAPVESRREVWFLNLEGRASSTYGDETATVGRFIKSLKEDEEFFKEFSKIELEIMQRRIIKDIEVMDFRVSCYFEEAN